MDRQPENGWAAALGVANRLAYGSGTLAGYYRSLGAWLDPGEQAAFTFAAPELRGRPLLDLGVGAGRTTSLMRLLTDDYVALDYSPAQVARCRAAHPGVDVRDGDARDLSGFAAGRFGGVAFSWSGLDTVGHDDRLTVLGEIHRVLVTDGLLVFCTLNQDGPLYRRPPWRRELPPDRSIPALRRLARAGVRFPLRARPYLREWTTWWRERGLVEEHGDWALAARGSGHGLVVHWTTLTGLRRDLHAGGFELLAAFESDGALLPERAARATSRWVHAVARRS